MLFRRKRHPKNSQLVRKTHRITGVIVAAMLLIVSFTGIILNHAEDIDLDGYVPGFLAGIYFSPSDQVNGYVANEQYFFVLSEELYVDSAIKKADKLNEEHDKKDTNIPIRRKCFVI